MKQEHGDLALPRPLCTRHPQGQTLPLRMPSLEWRLVRETPHSTHTDDVTTIWRPIGAPRYVSIGDVLRKGKDPPSHPVTMFLKNPQATENVAAMFAFPVHYLLVWREFGRGGLTVWRPQPPEGYQAIGCIAANGLDPPARTAMVCVRKVRTPSACHAPMNGLDPPARTAMVCVLKVRTVAPVVFGKPLLNNVLRFEHVQLQK